MVNFTTIVMFGLLLAAAMGMSLALTVGLMEYNAEKGRMPCWYYHHMPYSFSMNTSEVSERIVTCKLL